MCSIILIIRIGINMSKNDLYLAWFDYPNVHFRQQLHNVIQLEPLDWPFRQKLFAHKSQPN